MYTNVDESNNIAPSHSPSLEFPMKFFHPVGGKKSGLNHVATSHKPFGGIFDEVFAIQ